MLTAVCRFLVAIIENRSIDAERLTAHDKLLDTLLESISLYKLIHTMMTDQDSERNRVAGLEFLWMLADSRSDRGAAFLRQSQLVRDIFPYTSLCWLIYGFQSIWVSFQPSPSHPKTRYQPHIVGTMHTVFLIYGSTHGRLSPRQKQSSRDSFNTAGIDISSTQYPGKGPRIV